jgi:predicted Fe-S protein YdhL (DUF1289 family)
MNEITGWLFMDDKRKLEILENIKIRRAAPETEINDYDYYV